MVVFDNNIDQYDESFAVYCHSIFVPHREIKTERFFCMRIDKKQKVCFFFFLCVLLGISCFLHTDENRKIEFFCMSSSSDFWQSFHHVMTVIILQNKRGNEKQHEEKRATI